MSWRMLLSEYPDTLLVDQLALVLLVLIERGGHVRESEIQNDLAVDPTTIVHKLLALHRNKCIGYTKDHVSITDRGRKLIERFALDDEIVEDLLGQVPVSAENRTEFKNAILRYRTGFFKDYLDSVSAMRRWSRTSRITALRTTHHTQEKNTGIGTLAILLSDICRHVPTERGRVGTCDDTVAALLGSEHSNSRPMDDATKEAINWVVIYNKIEQSSSPWERLEKLESPAVGAFVAFQHSRFVLDSTEWIDRWSEDGEYSSMLQSCDTGSEAVYRIANLWKSDFHVKISERSKGVLPWEHVHSSNELPFGNMGDLLFHLLAARSVQHLSESTNLPGESLKWILEQIQTKCDKLLAPSRQRESQESSETAEGD